MGKQSVKFELSTGVLNTIKVPEGTIDYCLDRIEKTIHKAQLKCQVFRGNVSFEKREPHPSLNNKEASNIVIEHNQFVNNFYNDLTKWSKEPPKEPTEDLIPEISKRFWYGLVELRLPPHRWDGEFYEQTMKNFFQIMQGNKEKQQEFGIFWDESNKLTAKQAAEVIWLFAPFLDSTNIQLEIDEIGEELMKTEDLSQCCKCYKHFDTEHIHYNSDWFEMVSEYNEKDVEIIQNLNDTFVCDDCLSALIKEHPEETILELLELLE